MEFNKLQITTVKKEHIGEKKEYVISKSYFINEKKECYVFITRKVECGKANKLQKTS